MTMLRRVLGNEAPGEPRIRQEHTCDASLLLSRLRGLCRALQLSRRLPFTASLRVGSILSASGVPVPSTCLAQCQR